MGMIRYLSMCCLYLLKSFWKGILSTVGYVDWDISRYSSQHSGRYSGQKSVDSQSILGRKSVNIAVDSRSIVRKTIGRYFDDAPQLTVGHMSVIYRLTVGGILVNCRSNISHVLIYQVSPMAFFFSKEVINYCYHAVG